MYDAIHPRRIFSQEFKFMSYHQAHKERCWCVSFSPSDLKFATSSDDSTVKVHDFLLSSCESTLTGHGGDVRWVDWHPSRGVVASASKDASVKLWEPRSASCAATLHGHKNGVLQVSECMKG